MLISTVFLKIFHYRSYLKKKKKKCYQKPVVIAKEIVKKNCC